MSLMFSFSFKPMLSAYLITRFFMSNLTGVAERNKRCIVAYDKNFFEKSLEDNFWKFRFYVRVDVILHP